MYRRFEHVVYIEYVYIQINIISKIIIVQILIENISINEMFTFYFYYTNIIYGTAIFCYLHRNNTCVFESVQTDIEQIISMYTCLHCNIEIYVGKQVTIHSCFVKRFQQKFFSNLVDIYSKLKKLMAISLFCF